MQWNMADHDMPWYVLAHYDAIRSDVIWYGAMKCDSDMMICCDTVESCLLWNDDMLYHRKRHDMAWRSIIQYDSLLSGMIIH